MSNRQNDPKLDSRLVRVGECLEYQGARNAQDYGTITRRQVARSPLLVHRYMYWLVHGEWPEVVMHTCDNPPCCEPSHLVAGTIGLNNADMVKKGRAVLPPVRQWSVCPRGHDLTDPANRATNGPVKITCRECRKYRWHRRVHVKQLD